jgi:dTDP-4-dehydrorhamnose 3,5-epimerase
MNFMETKLKGSFVITPNLIEDERGFFARIFCSREFSSESLDSNFVQHNISFNKVKGTLRGMHYRTNPNAESKLVRCIRGAALDVIVDLRAGSSTFREWVATELTAANQRSVYIPKGFAHGFQTLKNNTELLYCHTAFYKATHEHGLRFDDPALSITWPLEIGSISRKDSQYPLLDKHFVGILI